MFFGLILIVIPTAFIGRKYRPCAASNIDSFPAFFTDYFRNQFYCGGFEWYCQLIYYLHRRLPFDRLWFLPALFVFSVMNIPLFYWFRNRYFSLPDQIGPAHGDKTWFAM